MQFSQFTEVIRKQYHNMQKTGKLFTVAIGRDELWKHYLASFPKGTDPMVYVATQHNCDSCKRFIKAIAGVVIIKDNKLVSIWDVEATGKYKVVAENMRNIIETSKIANKFCLRPDIATNQIVGSLPNTVKPDSTTIFRDKVGMRFTHFNVKVNKVFIKENSPTTLSKIKGKFTSHKRSCEEIPMTSVEIVKDLIVGGLYRGAEMLPAIEQFEHLLKGYTEAKDSDIYLWSVLDTQNQPIRTTVIGTLLLNVATEDLEVAVKKFEDKTAPSNYKRTNAIVTPKMKNEALKIIQKEGIEDSLYKKYAVLEDVSVNDVLFVNSKASSKMQDGIAGLMEQGTTYKPSLSKIRDTVSMEDFIANIVPKAEEISILVENKHQDNLVSLISPKVADAPNILQWDNNFSWAYNGGLTDSMKERVKAAGGRVDGVFRFTHSWNEIEPNQSLMDLHVFMPGCEIPTEGDGIEVTGRRVGWNNRIDLKSQGTQDVDHIIAAPAGYVPVENITFPKLELMPEGVYTCKVHNWGFRKTGGKGRAEIEFEGKVFQYEYPRTKKHDWITIAEVTLKNGKFTLKSDLPTSTFSKDIWGIKTQELVKVDSIMYSPNYWGDNAVGQKHTFFMLEGCNSNESIRGLYNEHLNNKFRSIRKSIDMLAPMLQCEQSHNMLAGLGFNQTDSLDLTVVVRGKEVSGTYKIIK